MNLPKVKSRKFYYILIAAVLVFFGWRIFDVISEKPVAEKQIPVVRTVVAGEVNAENPAVYPGEVRGRYESRLAFRIPGKITERMVDLGQNVKKGQVLYKLDPVDMQNNMNAHRAAYNAAAANLNMARDNYVRYEKLYSQNAVSAMVRDKFKTQYDAAKAQKESAEAQLSASKDQLSYTLLRADHAGKVAALMAEPGQVVAAGMPVVTVVQDGERMIYINIPENKLDSVYPGQKGKVKFWALKDLTAEGKVTEIAPMADSITRTYLVKFTMNNMPEEAHLGMTAKVELQEDGTDSILLPQSAIYQTGEKPCVWVVKDGKVSLRQIEIAGFSDNKVKVASGIKKGDEVVTGGINKLSEGQAVKPEGSVEK